MHACPAHFQHASCCFDASCFHRYLIILSSSIFLQASACSSRGLIQHSLGLKSIISVINVKVAALYHRLFSALGDNGRLKTASQLGSLLKLAGFTEICEVWFRPESRTIQKMRKLPSWSGTSRECHWGMECCFVKRAVWEIGHAERWGHAEGVRVVYYS